MLKTSKGFIMKVNWKTCSLCEIADFLDGKRIPLKKSDRKKRQGPYPYYGASGIIDWIDDYIFDDKLILLGEDGANILARSSRLAFQVSGKIWVNNHAHVIKPKKEVDIGFLCEYLENLDYTKFNTSITQPKLNKEMCLQIPISFPPLPEQRKIAEILSCWDRAIEKLSRIINLKKEEQANLSENIFRGNLRISKFGKCKKPGDLYPKGWEAQKAGSIFAPRSDRNNKNERVLSVTQDSGVVPRDTLDRKINMDGENVGSYKLVMPGDFIISLRSFQGGLEYSSYRGLVSPAYHVLKPIVELDNDFYRHFFKSHEFIGRLATSVIGIRDGKQISYTDFSMLIFPYPPLKEQKEIGKLLNSLDKEINILGKKVKLLTVQKSGLMSNLFSGKATL